MSHDVLNDDALNATYVREDGTVIRNLTADEYAASYADGTPCHAPLSDEGDEDA